jgi:hypothetical protein
VNFWNDFKGSLGGGQFYRDLLTRPIGKAWAYFFILVGIISVLFTILMAISFIRVYAEITTFMQESLPIINFEKGQIANMPQTRIDNKFPKWSVRVDSIYTDSMSALADSLGIPTGKPCLYIGPKEAYLIQNKEVSVFDYPASFTKTITAEEIQKSKAYVYPLAFVVSLVLNILKYLIFSLIYVFIIALIMVFKYRGVGLSYVKGIHAGLYLITIQLIVATLLGLIGIPLPYGFLWYILFYIIYIGVYINLSFAEKSQPAALN